MTDTEFLDYCYSHATTPRCGFVSAQIAKLLYLAGKDVKARTWERMPNSIIDCNQESIQNLVEIARTRLSL